MINPKQIRIFKPLLLTFSILILQFSFVFAQKTDSLWNVWNDETNADSIRIEAINGIIWSRFMNISNDSLNLLAEKMLDKSIKSGVKQREADAYFFIAVSVARQFNQDPRALEFFNKSLALNSELGNKRKVIRENKFIGLNMMQLYKIDEAKSYLQKSLELSNEIGYAKGISDYYLYMGLLFLGVGDYDKAKENFEESLNLLKKMGIKQGSKEWAYREGNLGKVNLMQGNYNEALKISIKIADIYKLYNDHSNLIIQYLDVGSIYRIKGDFSASQKYILKGLELADKYDYNIFRIRAYLDLGMLQMDLGNYTMSLDYLEKGLSLSKEIDEKSWLSECYLQTAKVYYELYEYSQSYEYLNQSLQLADEINSLRTKADVLNYLGIASRERNELNKSFEHFNQSLKINLQIGRKDATAENYLNIGKSNMDTKNYELAQSFFTDSRAIYEEIGSTKGMIETYLEIGNLNILQYNINEGITWCRKGYDIAVEIGVLKLEKDAAHCLYKAYKKLGNATEALKYYERYLALQDSLKTDEASKQLQQMEFERQRIADSLAMAQEKLETELVYQETLLREKSTRNTFMYAGFGILLLAGGFFSRMLYVRRTNKQLEEKNKLIALEKERAEASEKAKEQFFDNISHEFRTPLTLIKGPLEEVMKSSADDQKPRLQLIQKNADRLEQMINELLDLSKLEFGNVKLQAQEVNIVEVTRQYLQSFESLADQKKLTLSFKAETKDVKIWIDTEKYRKVLSNLLSNAIKFTPEYGSIHVNLNQSTSEDKADSDGVKIKVIDSGVGIPKDKLAHVFNRFYQVSDPAQSHHAGTGIGLSLTKELVELHHGTIRVDSESGKGTCFTIFLPSGNQHLTEEEMIIEYQEVVVNTQSETAKQPVAQGSPATVPVTNGKSNEDIPLLLVVEDNEDMRSYIVSHLKDNYTIIEAKNGDNGYSKASEHIPDLVISDVMMPEMNGNEMTKKLKSDHRTSHIPVVLLTARASVESKIEGLETGADAYITKPFNARELKVRVRKLIEQRQHLRDIFAKRLNAGFTVTTGDELSSMDQKFIAKAIKVITRNISNIDFDALLFASEMALSRSQLHRKIKALTSKSTSEFIRTIRLNKAAELLKHKTDNVAQIAYETGFSSLSWFSKMFRAQFGVSPSEFTG